VEQWLQTLVPGKSFADVGGLWGTVNEKITVAAGVGAASVTMIDVTPLEQELWRKLEDRCVDLGLAEYRFIEADINDSALLEDLPTFDIVYSNGLIYHAPNPAAPIANLARLCNEVLILGTTIIQDDMLRVQSGNNKNIPGALFVPDLGPESKGEISAYFAEAGIREMVGITSLTEWAPDDYAPWWWLFTQSAVSRLLESAGLQVVESIRGWQGRAAVYLCRKPAEPSGPEGWSGDRPYRA
jgi:hypothetical protein